jgi:hypothetical protein
MDLVVEIEGCDEGVIRLTFMKVFNFDNVSPIALFNLHVVPTSYLGTYIPGKVQVKVHVSRT